MKYSFEDLKGRNCVITGGFGVLGMALTRGLAEAGVNLAVISRSKDNPAKGEALAKEFGVKCLGISASTLDKEALVAARELIHQKLGKIDILINCAGGNSPKATCAVEQMDADTDLAQSFYGLDMEGFQFVYDLNFKGTLLATMVFTTDMIEAKKGVVLNISSMNAFRPLTKIPAYSAAKGAVNSFTKALATPSAWFQKIAFGDGTERLKADTTALLEKFRRWATLNMKILPQLLIPSAKVKNF